ncbi:MAG: shikimate kinase [Phoenicibacter congonensis]|uniref:Shikimate kinase n=1 Tax=Phoenicibacter congonensis TaxID=1944646 RepID=A0AA43U9S4_9ACTN|nr:shikimate kinase [Phoenicibacter congonensis]
MKAKLNKTVYFIGFMGAGKTTVARRLAKACSCECIDVDFYIQRMHDKTIPEIFEEFGEKGFRNFETEALEEIANANKPRFVSCGGGVITRDENAAIMKKDGIVIHLYSDAKNGARRISNKDSRPLFKNVRQAQKLFLERLPKYRKACDYEIITTRKNSGRVYHEVLDLLEDEGIIEIIEK